MPDVTVVVKTDLATAAKMHFFSKEAKVLKENVETNGNWLKNSRHESITSISFCLNCYIWRFNVLYFIIT